MLLVLTLILPVFIVEIGGNETSSGRPDYAPARAPSFVNVSIQAGLSAYRGDNLAWGDYNNDGYLDLLVRGPSSNYLFRNNGPPNWDFAEVSGETGVNITRGYSQWADYNADGYLDFYTAGDDDHLFRNNGPPNWDFTDVTSSAGNPSDGLPSEGIAWGDYNRDGYPDIFTVGWRKPGDLQWPYPGEMDRLYRNNGDGTFSDVSLSAGLRPRETSYAGMGVVWCDPNEDGWPDIYVSNYHLTPNQLWINQRDGTFVDKAPEYNLTGKATDYQGTTYYGHSNGAGWADLDNDQDMDLWVSHLAHKDDEGSGMNRGYYCADSQLFENSGPPYLDFTDIRVQAGIPITPSGTIVQDPDTGDYMWKDEDYFGIAWGDYENDGDLDIWVPQVKTYSFWDNSFLWENDGDSTFTDRTDASNLKVWSNTGGTFVDYDNDGNLDFCTEGTYPYKGPRQLHLFRNPGNSNHWLELDLRGAGGNDQTSTDATGTKVVAKSGDLTLTRYVGGDCGGHGFQQPQRLHFGLGTRTTIDEIWIYWTSGRIQKVVSMPVDGLYEIKEPTTQKLTITGPDLFEIDEDGSVDIVISTTGAPVTEMYWDLDNDRIFETPDSDGTQTLSYYTHGWRWIRFRARDTYGTYRDLEPLLIKVSNVMPEIFYPDVIELNESEKFLIEPVVLDTSSDLESGNMSYYWDMGDGNWEHSLDPGRTVSFDDMGNYLIRFMVVDDDGASDTHDIGIMVVNRMPEVTLSGEDLVTEGRSVTFTAAAVDSPLDMDRMEYRFYAGDGRSTGWQRSNEATFKYTENGTFRAAVEVIDRHDETASAFMEVTVVNVVPFVHIEQSGYFNMDEEIVFNIELDDTENDMEELRVIWDFGDGSPSTGWTSSLSTRHTFTEPGSFTVNATVKDGDGATYSHERNIFVRNLPPTCVILSPTITETSEDVRLFFTAEVSDTPSDEDDLYYEWKIVDRGNVEYFYELLEFDHLFELSGTYNVTFTVRDEHDDYGYSKLQINVSNIAPKAELYSTKRSSYKDESVRFDATRSTDTESDLETLRYHWDLGDGTKSYGGPVIDHTYTTSGIMRVILTVIDDDSDMDTEEIMFVVSNAPPLVYIDAPDEVEVDEWFWVDASATTDTISDISNLVFTYDMGDGTEPIVTDENVLNYSYSEKGLYTITLSVSDGGSDTTEKHFINVVEPPKEPVESSNTGLVIVAVVLGAVMIILLAVVALVLISRSRQPPPPPGMPPAMPPGTPAPGLYARPAQGLPPPNLPPPPMHP